MHRSSVKLPRFTRWLVLTVSLAVAFQASDRAGSKAVASEDASKPATAEKAPAKPKREPAPEEEDAKPDRKPARKSVKLPGLVINLEKRHVDVESTVCLDQGLLELIACTKGTKEHESIVVINAKAMHVHTALLLLGAKPGSPAMRKRVGEEKKRWVDVPPSGDPVEVYLVFESPDGKSVERPIGDFVTPSENRVGEGLDADKGDAGDGGKFPHRFLFAGSHYIGEEPGPRKYLSDLSGNVISISTFGDELLCLPGIHSNDNGLLMWEVDSTHLPKVGSKVTLRLRPAAVQTREADKTRPEERPGAADKASNN